MFKPVLFILCLSCAQVYAAETATASLPQSSFDVNRDEYRSFLIGHNVSPTSYTLPKGAATVGTYAAGYGFAKNVMLATSPWIDYFYNMRNLHLRAATQLGPDQRLMLGLSYFKSYGHLFEKVNNHWAYQQESVTAQLVHSYNVSPVYTIHTVATYMNYMDDTAPFSLRMAPFTNDPSEIILSTLHEARLTRRLGLNGEVGVLGLNYPYPYLHYGGSFVYISSAWLFQVGISHTMILANVDLPKSSGRTDRVHPEIQAQMFF